MNIKPIAYLAAPYSDPNPLVRDFRLRAVTYKAYELFREGRLVYSPLTHNIPIDTLGFSGDFQHWLDFDHAMLAKCDSLIVFKLPGFENSKGLKAEIEFAQATNKPIEEIIPTKEFLQQIARLSANKEALALLL